MTRFFIHLFNMSITASWLVLAVIILRLLLKKAPKAITVALWALVGIRLLLPFSIESIFSLVPSAETVPQKIVFAKEPTIDSGVAAINSVVNPLITDSFAPKNELTSINPIQVFLAFAEVVWFVGMIAMVLYTLISYLRLRMQVRESVPLSDNIYVCDGIATPFILGVFRPRIYLPSGMGDDDKEYVIAHEKAHLRRGDHLWKPLGFLLLTVYWFNPVLWLAYILLCRGIELACDERVIRDMELADKKAYSTALLNCSIPRKMISACPLAFGEVGVKQRIKSVLHYKKPAFWIIVIALIATVGIAVGFLTDPKKDTFATFDEDGRFGDLFDNVETMALSYQYEHYLWLSEIEMQDAIQKLGAIEITHDPISLERKEDLRGTYSIHINENRKNFHVICFNAALDRFWIRDSVKPSFVYGVKDPAALREIFRVLPNKGIGGVDIPNITVTSTLAQVNMHEGTRLYMGALNRDKMYISSVKHLPIYKFENVTELESFVTLCGEEIDFSYKSSLSDVPSFADATAKYDDAFFTENVLFAVYVYAPQCDNEYRLASSHFSEAGCAFHIVTQKQGQLEAILNYMMLIEVNRGAIAGCTVFDATMDAIGIVEETVIGTWQAPMSILGLAPEDTPKDPKVTFVFREDGTGVESAPTVKDRNFLYTVDGKFLTLTYVNDPPSLYNDSVQFSYEQTRDTMRLGRLKSATLNDALELTRVSHDTLTPVDDMELQPNGRIAWQFFKWTNLPEKPQNIGTLSFTFQKFDTYSVSSGQNMNYIDNLRLENTEGDEYVLSFQIFQDSLPYTEDLLVLLNSIVTLTYEGEVFDVLDKANEHVSILINGEKATLTEVRSGAGNGHRDFYFTILPAAPIEFKVMDNFEFVIS